MDADGRKRRGTGTRRRRTSLTGTPRTRRVQPQQLPKPLEMEPSSRQRLQLLRGTGKRGPRQHPMRVAAQASRPQRTRRTPHLLRRLRRRQHPLRRPSCSPRRRRARHRRSSMTGGKRWKGRRWAAWSARSHLRSRSGRKYSFASEIAEENKKTDSHAPRKRPNRCSQLESRLFFSFFFSLWIQC